MRLLLSSLWLIGSVVFAENEIYYPEICNGTLEGSGEGFNKPGPKMPTVGDSFRTKIQCNLNGEDGRRTIEESEVFVSEKSRDRKRSSVIYRDYNSSMQIITDYLYGERLFIEQLQDSPRVCKAQNLTTAMGRWIFNGTDGNVVHAYTASAFLKMAETFKDQTYLGKYMVRGINVNAWTQCYQWDSVKATFNITFFWSDPESWTPAMYTPEKKDRTIPVSITVHGKGKFGKNGQEKSIFHEYDFIQFNEFEPSNSEFDIPPDTYCQNLPRADRILTLPKTFSFNSEVVTTEYEASVILYQKHFYDSELNITRFDYKPFNDAYYTDTFSQTGVITRIHDFETGISAEFDNYLGNCTMKPIPLEAGDAVDVGNKVRLVDPFTFMGINNKIKFKYYRQTQHREIEALVYVGLQDLETTAIVHELWYALQTDKTEGTGKWVMNQPLRYLQYNLKDPKVDRIDMNIFHFDDDRPDVSLYDVSICVDDKHKYTCSFELDGNAGQTLQTNRTYFQRQVLMSIMTYSGLSFLQISNIQFDSSGENTRVIFNLLEINVKGDGEDTKPGPSVEDAMEALEKKISKGDVSIGNPDQRPLLFKVKNFQRNTTTTTLYSSGSMALAAILSIIIGGIIGAVALYFLVKKNKLNLNRSSDGFNHATFTNEPDDKA